MGKRETKLTQEIVRELLDYDPVKGAFTWKWRERHWFVSDSAFKSWNKKFAGKAAFTSIGHGMNGEELYHTSTILHEKGHVAHRVAFLWMLGRWPDELDHKNRNKKDFRWDNLREVSRATNMQNKDKPKSNISGRVGVRKHPIHGKFEARITVNKKTLALGVFKSFKDAVAAREAAELQYGFTPSNRGTHSNELRA